MIKYNLNWSYKASFDNTINYRKFMVVGVDWSRFKGNKTGVAMVSTIKKLLSISIKIEALLKRKIIMINYNIVWAHF